MHFDIFDQYQSLESAVHRLDPRIKVVVAISFILSNVLLPDGAWMAFALSGFIVIAISVLAGLGPIYVLKRSLIALPFALAALSVIFALPGRGIMAIELGSWRLVATDAGLLRFASILLRSWLSVQMAILLTGTTQFPDLLHAMRHLRVPATLVNVIAFMYRYLFVLIDEVMRLLRARDARSARSVDNREGGRLLWRAQVAGNMAGQLFLRSYDRSERVYAAMLARGYRGQILTINPHEMRARDWLAAGLAFLVLAALQVFARIYG
jgi:cobalt/nickel transport system permease protein